MIENFDYNMGEILFSICNNIRHQFRLVANLDREVDRDVLQQAVDKVMPRYPMYRIVIRKRWNSVREAIVSDMPIAVTEFENTYTPFDIYAKKPLVRVMYRGKKVVLEFFHTVTDANGSVSLLNTLLACYFELLGEEVDKTNILDYNEEPRDEEFEDGFHRYARKARGKISPTRALFHKAFVYKAKSFPKGTGAGTTYSLDLTTLKTAAKKYGCTLNEYFVTTFCMVFNRLKAEKGSKKCVRIQMPINLRTRFPSSSLRNFVSSTQFDTKSVTKEEILSELRTHMQLATSENELMAMMWSAESLARTGLRIMPRFLGDFLIGVGDKILGEKANSTSFSNLGMVKNNLDQNGVISYEFIEGIPLYAPFMFSSLSYKNICSLTIVRKVIDDIFDRYLMEELANDGVVLSAKTEYR